MFGTNAIAAYFFAEVVAHLLSRINILSDGAQVSLQEYIYSHWFAPLASTPNASLLYAVGFVAVCWAAMAVLYRKGITLRI